MTRNDGEKALNLLNFIMNFFRRRREIAEELASERKPSPIDVVLPRRLRMAVLRLTVIILVTWCACKWLCLPLYIKGASMEPTYSSNGFNFCWTPAFLLSQPKTGDIVIVKYAGTSAMLLKRVVATEGQTLQFSSGKLLVDGIERQEPYVKGPCNWELPPRKVSPGCIYIVGDNRSMPIEQHVFGEVELKKVKGAPLW